jgi:hypothetical protein
LAEGRSSEIKKIRVVLILCSDGHYGLWLDDNLENGVSDTCLTFGNEPLSDDGKKFEVMGVELWYIGSQ